MPSDTEDLSRPVGTGDGSGWPLLVREILRHRWNVAAGVAVAVGWTVAKVSVPLLAQHEIDQGIIGHHHGSLLRWSLIILAVGVAQGACMGFRRFLAFSVSYAVETELRQRLFAHFQRLHFAFHDRAQTGQLMSRSASDLTQIQNLVVLIPLTMANVLIVLAVVAVLFYLSPILAALALCTLPFVPLVARSFSQRVFPVSMELQRELGSLATVVEETVSGIRVVKGFGTEKAQAERLHAASSRVYDKAVGAGRLRAIYTPMLAFLPLGGLVAVLWYGGHQVLAHHLTIGQITAFSIYVTMLVAPLSMTGWVIAQAQRAIASAQRVNEILSMAPVVRDPSHTVPLPPSSGGGNVRFRDATFAYEGTGGRLVLDGFELDIAAGEAVALVGATGCGKSTVARLIPRFYDLDSGSVEVDGIDVRSLRLKELRQAIGLVFEDTFLFTDTIGANIAFADPKASMDRIRAAARLAGADDFITGFPDGYDTVIGERGYSLSGGQRQRVALARAILSDPRILILDDATSAVDPTKEQEILAAMAEVMRGRTTLIIAHRAATVALASRVVVMDAGTIVAEGTHEGLLADNAHYADIMSAGDHPGPETPTGTMTGAMTDAVTAGE